MNLDAADDFEEASREVLLACDARGVVTSVDARAARVFAVEVGARFDALAVPGTEEQARAFVERAAAEDLVDWEIALMTRDAPAVVSFTTKRSPGGGARLLGLLVPPSFTRSLDQLHASMDEVLDLSRQISKQKKELAVKNEELTRAYVELDESNRGVLTLHAELADKADTLRRTAEVKTRVVANVSHEFRTPLHTILGLSKILLDGSDGPLGDEQRKQVRFIRTSAEELSELVNDMLDLSKAESGRSILRPDRFKIGDFFAGLRGALRPLGAPSQGVDLVFDPPPEDLELNTDQSKLAQIIRNLVSNALKFTERGAVRISAARDGDAVVFRVADTGIGIAPQHFDRVFEEFGQIDSAIQKRVKGTGLGLPLSRKLAELLGGTLTVESKLGEGSTFIATVPAMHPEVEELQQIATRPLDPARAPVLVVEDDRKTIFVYEKYLSMAGFQVLPARSAEEATRILDRVRPAAIVLDIMLEGESSWTFLSKLKNAAETRDIPVLVVTVTNKEQKARALGADEFWLKPVDKDRLVKKLRTITQSGSPARVLVIDDDERARYLVRKLLTDTPYVLVEACDGPEGIARARAERPDVILLDFLLRDMTAFDVLDELKSDPLTRSIPVIVVTSHVLDADARKRLKEQTEAIVSKESLSRELAINRIRDALGRGGFGAIHANQRGT